MLLKSQLKRVFFVFYLFVSFPSLGQTMVDKGSVGPAYGLSSAFLGLLNVGINSATIVQLSKLQGHKGLPVLGFLSGAAQITLGALNRQKDPPFIYGYPYPIVNEKQRNLTIFNVGFGSVTILLSTINLMANKQNEQRTISWNAESFQTTGSSMGFGVSFKKRF